VTTLAKAVLAIADHPFPMKFDGPGADMLKSLAPHSHHHQDGGGQHLAVLAAAGQPDRQDPGGRGHAAHHHRPDHAEGLAQGERPAAGRHGLDQLPHRARRQLGRR
jgi:hypothetical protein